MAQVYRAVDRQLDRPVALKVLFPELSVDKTFVERFRREAQAAANLSHPNIVPVFDWGEDDGSYFIVMEYVDGRPLSAVIKDPEPLPSREIAGIGAGVAAALAFAHRHGVVHRDVKPGNVLITPDGEVKVTDFGIARAVNTEESLTQTGAVMGTAAYFSPEQAEGKGVDARSDIYSLGVVLYEMAVGKPPFTGDSPVAVASKHVRDQPIPPRVANPAVPTALNSIIMKAMAKNPDDRYGSAEELRADLLRFADGRPVEAVDPGVTSMMTALGTTSMMGPTTGTLAVLNGTTVLPGQDDAERKKRNRRLVILLVILLVALGIIAFFLLRSVLVSKVNVPAVTGVPQTVATQTLKNEGLAVGTVSFETNAKSKGIVLSQNPTAGTSVDKDTTVDLVVSNGPHIPIVTVPTVTGLQLTAAIPLISAQGLNYSVRDITSPKPVGTVISQTPAGGAKVKQNVPVVLTVSGTQSEVSVPSVLGQSPAAAGSQLTHAGLSVGSQTSACSSQFQRRDRRVTEPARRRHRAAQHAGQHRGVERQLRLGARRDRPVGQRGAERHHQRRVGAEHDLRHGVCQRRAARPGRQSEPGPGDAGGQRQHGQHLGLPGRHHDVDVQHDHDDDQLDHDEHPVAPARAPAAGRDGLRPSRSGLGRRPQLGQEVTEQGRP